MNKRFTAILLSGFLAGGLFAQNSGVLFQFKHRQGESTSYISTVEENVYVNRHLSHHAKIVNRISSNVVNVSYDGAGFIFAKYMTSENSISNNTGVLRMNEEENSSVFLRNKNGEMVIADDLIMPTVRNVPVFPNKKVAIGESWTAQGKEVQDVGKVFNLAKPLIFPFTATYTYKGDVKEDGKVFNVIELSYNFKHVTPENQLENGVTLYSSTGYSKQLLYWDNNRGLLDHYSEEFQIALQDVQGNVYLFTGSAQAQVTEYKSVNDDDTVHAIEETIAKLNLKNISVKRGEKGLTISLDNIQFLPDSDVLQESEKEKLMQIAKILNEFSNDLLITGHTAARGTVKARQQLSEERAESVANYLLELGVRDRYHIFTQGKGSTEPVATNATEEGRSLNRRVEITIMD